MIKNISKINDILQTNMTPLILASSAGRDKVVNTLIAEGANVNAQTTEGHSALQYAASKNWQNICVKLVENSADINISDKRGATPLHRAASKGNIEVLKFLLAQEGLKIGNLFEYYSKLIMTIVY